jgi:Na+/H+ antiporter NhaA
MLVPAGSIYCSTMEVSRKPEQVSLWLLILLLGILSLLGNRVPLSLKIFLTALAVIDEERLWLLPYFTQKPFYGLIFYALGTMLILFVLNRMKVKSNSLPFGGVIMWWFMLHSGIHATVTGVLLAFVIPFGNGERLYLMFCNIFCINRLVLILPLLHWQIRR